MNPKLTLDEAEMAQPRSPDDLRAWVEHTCKALASSPEAKTYARSGARLPKKFYDEIFPLSLLMAYDYAGRRDVLVTPSLGSDNFDARIEIGQPPNIETTFVETTFARDGHDDSLRMEVLAKEGHVFMTGTVTVRGRRGSPQRIVHVEPAAENHAVSIQNYLSLVESRVAAKSNVVYGPSHTLLVAIDDYHPMIEEDDWSQLAKNAEAWLARYPLDFARVALVGVSGRHFLTRDV